MRKTECQGRTRWHSVLRGRAGGDLSFSRLGSTGHRDFRFSTRLEPPAVAKDFSKQWMTNDQLKIIGTAPDVMCHLLAVQNAEKQHPHKFRKPQKPVAQMECTQLCVESKPAWWMVSGLPHNVNKLRNTYEIADFM